LDRITSLCNNNTKAELAEKICILEHNNKALEDTIGQQYKNIMKVFNKSRIIGNELAELIINEYLYIVKDEDSELYAYTKTPVRIGNKWERGYVGTRKHLYENKYLYIKDQMCYNELYKIIDLKEDINIFLNKQEGDSDEEDSYKIPR